ncbi:hypothetical protein SAY87_031644 [Trapa incisa]|uniref:RIN4 pathogenic type III effector avirulence factor Avr cleavage site domain-containing protein n=1 Tax=Trapa incisa TaxID=236973 RepID=A0AAN7KY38_9MYRT|nr:hypothetical protein SAY87_031644 [Trapa incisa]
MSDKGQPLPKFGEWDVNDPASAEGFTAIFNKARDEKKTGGQTESPGKAGSLTKSSAESGKPLKVSFLFLLRKNGFAAFRAQQQMLERCHGSSRNSPPSAHVYSLEGSATLLKDKGA